MSRVCVSDVSDIPTEPNQTCVSGEVNVYVRMSSALSVDARAPRDDLSAER